MTRVDRLDRPPEVGEKFLVDCVAVVLVAGDAVVHHLPVLGPAHSDVEFGVVRRHFHLDQRFASDETIRRFGVLWWCGEDDDGDVPPPPPLVVAEMTCTRSWAPFRVRLDGLAQKYVGKSAVWDGERGAWLCPHRGAYLGNCKARHGCLTCPMHALKIKVPGGKVSGKYP